MKVNNNLKIPIKTHQKKKLIVSIKIRIILSLEIWNRIHKTTISISFIQTMELMNSRAPIYPNWINRINFYLNFHSFKWLLRIRSSFKTDNQMLKSNLIANKLKFSKKLKNFRLETINMSTKMINIQKNLFQCFLSCI